MKTIYKSKQSEIAIKELYDRQLKALNMEYEDLFVDTRFGKTHVVKIGNQNGKPLLVIHGGNNTAPYELSYFSALLSFFCVYAVDTVGHPGKSSQTIVSPNSMKYGEWASDVISGLGFQKMNCLGASLGGGILIKLMCAAPEKVEKSVLVAPAGIADASMRSLGKLVGIPMILYAITKKDKYLKKVILAMAIEEKNIDEATLEMFKYASKHVTAKVAIPSIAKTEDLQGFNAPTLIIVSEHDNMFPSNEILAKAEKMIPNLKTNVLKGQGHKFVLPDDVITMIKEFIEN